MSKKTWILVFLCLFVLSSAMLAEDKEITVVESLYFFYSGFGEWHYMTIDDPSHHETESEPILRFNVPPSPSSDIILFELGSLSHVWWLEGHSPQEYSSALFFKIISDAIPEDISIRTGCYLEGMRTVTDIDAASRPQKNNYKIILRRNGLLREYRDWGWEITYISTGENVPIELANSILNNIMDKGFDAEVTQVVQTEGVVKTWLMQYYIDLTRHTKIKYKD